MYAAAAAGGSPAKVCLSGRNSHRLQLLDNSNTLHFAAVTCQNALLPIIIILRLS